MPHFKAAKTAVLALSLSTLSACATTRVKMDPYAPIDVSRPSLMRSYRQNGADLDPRSMEHELLQRPASRSRMRQAKVLHGLALASAVAGGALVGWAIGKAEVDDEPPDLMFAKVGGGLIGLSIGLAITSTTRFNAAVRAHNRGFNTAP